MVGQQGEGALDGLLARAPFGRWCNLKREFAKFYKKLRNRERGMPGTQLGCKHGLRGKDGDGDPPAKPDRSRLPGMAQMLAELDLELEGHHHSGIDDCRNLARIVARMASDGCVLTANGKTRES